MLFVYFMDEMCCFMDEKCFMYEIVTLMDENVAFMNENVALMDENVLIMVQFMDENCSFAGPSGRSSGAAAACRNVQRHVRTSESTGNTWISSVQSLWMKNAGYG